MRIGSLISSGIMIAVLLGTGACTPSRYLYTGPGCLIQIYTLPNAQGSALPVVRDTPELAEAWRSAASVQVIYGTWRLFADQDYKGFMGDYRAPAVVPFLRPTAHLGSLQCIKPEPAPPSPGY
jgi:hypothetical protein